jgi:hypothetical protein
VLPVHRRGVSTLELCPCSLLKKGGLRLLDKILGISSPRRSRCRKSRKALLWRGLSTESARISCKHLRFDNLSPYVRGPQASEADPEVFPGWLGPKQSPGRRRWLRNRRNCWLSESIRLHSRIEDYPGTRARLLRFLRETGPNAIGRSAQESPRRQHSR